MCPASTLLFRDDRAARRFRMEFAEELVPTRLERWEQNRHRLPGPNHLFAIEGRAFELFRRRVLVGHDQLGLGVRLDAHLGGAEGVILDRPRSFLHVGGPRRRPPPTSPAPAPARRRRRTPSVVSCYACSDLLEGRTSSRRHALHSPYSS